MDLPKMYQHFKGNFYIVVRIAKHHSNGTEWAVYRQVGDENTYYVRPFSQFNETVLIPHTRSEPARVLRFRPVSDKEASAMIVAKLREEAKARMDAATTDEEKVAARLTELLADKLESELLDKL